MVEDLDDSKENNNLRFETIENNIKAFRNGENAMMKLLEKMYQAQMKTWTRQKLVSFCFLIINCLS